MRTYYGACIRRAVNTRSSGVYEIGRGCARACGRPWSSHSQLVRGAYGTRSHRPSFDGAHRCGADSQVCLPRRAVLPRTPPWRRRGASRRVRRRTPRENVLGFLRACRAVVPGRSTWGCGSSRTSPRTSCVRGSRTHCRRHLSLASGRRRGCAGFF
ncbi:hypothetical protein C8R44DRAFT_826273 [Mycena epipterygia]|nr:hypothetical protein C8R44DRAFT_826273 [Mycena epipterygia]